MLLVRAIYSPKTMDVLELVTNIYLLPKQYNNHAYINHAFLKLTFKTKKKKKKNIYFYKHLF